MEHQSQASQVDLDLKTREARIERLRGQQQSAKNNREYQTFLVEINTEKVDKTKAEDQLLKLMETVERLQAESAELDKGLASEQAKLTAMQAEINERVKHLQAEIEALRPERDAAAAALTAKARDAFERLAERFEGEAMSALAKPDRRREEYACSACNMDLVTDIYNKLHSRDELVFCPSCHRILFIPDDLPVELAVNKVKERKEPRTKTSDLKASIGRQTSADAVMKSVTIEEDAAPGDEVTGDVAAGDVAAGQENTPQG
jgi:predicted  nucleic acid-binding Zn-ribbon protein